MEKQDENKKNSSIDESLKELLMAYMDLLIICQNPSSFLGKKRQLKQIEDSFNKLHISEYEAHGEKASELEELWSDFFRFYIPMCLDSPSYRSAVLGLGDIKASGAKQKLTSELESIQHALSKFSTVNLGSQAFLRIFGETLDAVILPGQIQ